jgi:hypothetical protein
MHWESKIAVAAVMFVVGSVILLVLWPGDRQGARLLRRWNVTGASAQDVADAVRYLRRRRLWYPWLFLALPAVGLTDDNGNSQWGLVGTVLVGGLLAEILAQRPSPGPRRSASLAQRGILDFVPLWALIVSGIAVVAVVLQLAFAGRWLPLGTAVVTTGLAWLIVLLAVRRPSIGRPEVDHALRTRSARVAVGLGIAAPASLVGEVSTGAGAVFLLLSLIAFRAIVQPDSRRTPVTAG